MPMPMICHGHLVGEWFPEEPADWDRSDSPRDCEPRPFLTEIETCYLCLEPLAAGDYIDMDHVLPRSRGGDDSLLMPVHAECNRSKNNRPLMARPRKAA